MSTQDESWKEQFSDSKEGGDRDGSRPQPSNENRTGGFSRSGRPLRPRISRPAFSANADGRTSRPPRPTAPREGGYQQRPRYNREEGYQSRSEGGYQPRPRYNREEGYQPRSEGGYQPRPRYNREEGYQPRSEGGYQPRPRYNRDGDNAPRQGAPTRRPRTADYNPHAKYNMKKQIEYKETHYDPNQPIRLNRFLANAGVCSRREADAFIQAGVVSVNGEVVTELGTKVLRSDSVMFHDQPVSLEKKVYVLLNKPKDCVTTSDDPKNRKTVMDIVKDACRERIYPVGRLDRNTTGVLLLTNDGELASKLTHPQYKKKKIYHVFLNRNVAPEDIRRIADGIMLDDGEIHADAIDYASPTDRRQVGIEIHSGRNRIVRRIFEHLGYRVSKLDRVYFAGLTKKNVRRGDWRFLTEREVSMLQMGAFE
ncbi:MAG: RNA-binding S4 domain-containing protein [Bacteroidaceae bacterium]|nr:RNA-binding S4 domain-containing protein [Bacteroidaceae bacterium]